MLHDKIVIPVSTQSSDVKSLTVSNDGRGLTLLGVNDADSDDSADGRALITAQLSRFDVRRVISALMAYADISPSDL